MRRNTQLIEHGELGQVDLVALGARTGMLWRSNEATFAGLGEPELLDIVRGSAASQVWEILEARSGERPDVPGAGVVGFTALPFDPDGDGLLVVPPVTLCETGGQRFVTMAEHTSLVEIETDVRTVLTTPIRPHPAEVRLELDRPADVWRDQVVSAARDQLRATTTEKVVLARELSLHASTDFPTELIVADLADRFRSANVFAVDGFIGASPELLVSRIGRTVRAHPLAGTSERSDDGDRDAALVAELLASSKDRVEHRITIDWLLAELLPFCSYVDAEPEPSIVTLANVHHLGTLVEGMLSEPAASILDLVTAVHPTPAVGGNPQADALELITELEGFDRGRYAGPAGWVDAAGNGEFAVSVRTAQVTGSTAVVAAGVGVVEQSDPEAELAETQAKFAAMLGSFFGSHR